MTSRMASLGTPRRPSSRRSSSSRSIASAKLSRASSLVLPCPLAAGISGQEAMYQSSPHSMTAVNSLRNDSNNDGFAGGVGRDIVQDFAHGFCAALFQRPRYRLGQIRPRLIHRIAFCVDAGDFRAVRDIVRFNAVVVHFEYRRELVSHHYLSLAFGPISDPALLGKRRSNKMARPGLWAGGGPTGFPAFLAFRIGARQGKPTPERPARVDRVRAGGLQFLKRQS